MPNENVWPNKALCICRWSELSQDHEDHIDRKYDREYVKKESAHLWCQGPTADGHLESSEAIHHVRKVLIKNHLRLRFGTGLKLAITPEIPIDLNSVALQGADKNKNKKSLQEPCCMCSLLISIQISGGFDQVLAEL